jgi:lipopolysaccharide export system permease protein
MKIFYWYILKKFLNIFIFAILAIAFLVVVSEVFYRLGYYLEHKVSLLNIILLLIMRTPWQTILAFPIATLIAILFSLGNLSQKNEITAIKSAGINLWKIMSFFMLIGFFIGIIDLSAREFIVPHTTTFYEKLNQKIKNEGDYVVTQFSDFVISPGNNIRLTAKLLDTQKKSMDNIVIEYYDEDFHIQKLLIAERAVWRKDRWLLINGVERLFENNLWKGDILNFKQYDSGIKLNPQDLIIEDVKYASMTTKQLLKYINQLRIFGNSAIRARIELNVRYAMIFSHLIVMMVGIPFALAMSNKLKKIINFTFALFGTFLFWGTQSITQAMAQSMIISPFLSAWLPNLIFIGVGTFMLTKVSK